MVSAYFVLVVFAFGGGGRGQRVVPVPVMEVEQDVGLLPVLEDAGDVILVVLAGGFRPEETPVVDLGGQGVPKGYVDVGHGVFLQADGLGVGGWRGGGGHAPGTGGGRPA